MRINFGAVTSTVVSALSLSHPVQKFLDVYFWDGVLHLVTSDPFLEVLKDYGPAVAILLGGLYLSTAAEDRAAWWQWAKQKLNLYLVLSGACVIGAIIFLAAYLMDYRRGPIIWHFDRPQSPIQFNGPGTGPFVVFTFSIIGTNRWDDPITPTNAYIRSNITGQTLALEFPQNRPVQSGTISPGAEFYLIAFVSPQREAGNMSIPDFRRQFGSFTFVFESPQKNYSIRFDEAEVDRKITVADRLLRSNPPPSVVFK